MKIIKTTLLISILAALHSCHQPKQKTEEVYHYTSATDTLKGVISLVTAIENGGRFEDRKIGEEGRLSMQWKRYEQLKKITTVEQLVFYSVDSNTVVRCYAFLGLCSKGSDQVLPVLLKHLDDTARVAWQKGCHIGGSPVNEEFISIAKWHLENKDLSKLTDAERMIVDSVFTKSKW